MKKVVFLLSGGHSGSTLFNLILGSHSTGFSLGGLKGIADHVNMTEKGYIPVCGICTGECEFWNKRVSQDLLRSYFGAGNSKNKLVYTPYAHLGSFKFDIYDYLFERSGASMLINSCKSPWWIKRQLRPRWHWRDTTPYLLYVYRDGRAVANSFLRKYPDWGMGTIAANWQKTTLHRENYFQKFPEERRLAVSYEELATEPEKIAADICRWLGLDYEPGMLRYWEADHHIAYGNLGTRSLIFKYREQFDDAQSQYWAHENKKGQTVQTDETYYDQVGLAIKLDLRWQRELDQQQLQEFEAVAGATNERYAYNGPVSIDGGQVA